MGRILIYILIALVVLAIIYRLYAQFGTRPPANIGKNLDCPNKPNCVSSAAADDHAIDPLTFDGDAQAAHDRLLTILKGLPRTTIETDRPDYIHAVTRSALWGFPDDVEFVIGDGRIDVRSAARMGQSDLGVNRARIEAIRAQFE